MMNASGEIAISRPIDEVFAFVTDFENDVLWVPEVFSTDRDSGEKRTVGTRYSIVAGPSIKGKIMKQSGGYEVTKSDPSTVFEWSMWQGGATGTASYTLRADADGTVLRYDSHASMPGIMKLMEPGTRALTQYWRIPRMLKILKAYLESNADQQSTTAAE